MTAAELVREYRARTPRSAQEFRRAAQVLPGGETRSVTSYPPYPVIVTSGRGAELCDVDGNRYLDLVNNYTSLVHGNAHPAATEAVARCLSGGLAFASPHERQLELAELLVARVPSVELVRFTCSGSEAAVLAARLARHVTGRRGLLVFDGAYHGSAPPLLPGEPDVVQVPYNDLDAAERAMTSEVAAVFVEPFLGAGGVVPGRPAFLTGLAELARGHGALFVLDEVQALRNDVGGMQSRLGLHPDLTLLGKIIGGGLPIGAVGGRADLLRRTASRSPGHLAHSGTFNGHIAAAAAGTATLHGLPAAAVERLDRSAERLAARIAAHGAAAGHTVSVTRAGSILNVHFAGTVPVDGAQARRAAATPLLPALHLALLLEGIYTTPRGMINLSTALDADDLERVADGYARAFRALAS